MGPDVEEPLLSAEADVEVIKPSVAERAEDATSALPAVRFQDVWNTVLLQSGMAWPLLLNLTSSYAVSLITLAFVGHIGKEALAAASIGTSFVGILARMVLMGLCGALDTQASQAYGHGNLAELPPIFQRTLMFLWLHALPVTAMLLAVPKVLAQQGGDPQLAAMALSYMQLLIPGVWMECLARSLNRILVAQRIARPQMGVALLVVPLHVATNYLLIHKL
ncbi:hypothetical protein QJQ45_020178, partial [Haematococcus lacustris]